MAIGYIYQGRYMPADEYYAAKAQEQRPRSGLPAPRIIQDGIEMTSMLDGKTYTSKSALRATYRANGVEEVGNEKLTRPATREYRPEGVRDDVRRAIAQAS
jgi:hypothetical protein